MYGHYIYNNTLLCIILISYSNNKNIGAVDCIYCTIIYCTNKPAYFQWNLQQMSYNFHNYFQAGCKFY